jgi:hypothetical protein
MSSQNNSAAAAQPPPAAQLAQLLRGSLITQLIYVAARLGIADLLRDGPRHSDELAQTAAADPRTLYRILRALAGLGIFAEQQPHVFELTPLAEPLRSDVSGSLHGSALVYGDRWWWQACGELLHSVTSGQTAFEQVHGQTLFDYLGQSVDAAALFNRHQSNMTRQDAAAVVEAYDFSVFSSIVDIGGGLGALAGAILQACPHTGVILFDQPAVIDAAKASLSPEPGARCQLVGGDFFIAVPAGGDAYVLKDIIHDWDDELAISILQNCRKAMTAGAANNRRLLLIEKVIPAGNEPFAGKLTDITMLLITGGMERTGEEYRALLEKAGFALTRIVATRSPASVIEAVPV